MGSPPGLARSPPEQLPELGLREAAALVRPRSRWLRRRYPGDGGSPRATGAAAYRGGGHLNQLTPTRSGGGGAAVALAGAALAVLDVAQE